MRSEGWLRDKKKEQQMNQTNQNMPRPHSRREPDDVKALETNVVVQRNQDESREITMCQVMQVLVGCIKEFCFYCKSDGKP